MNTCRILLCLIGCLLLGTAQAENLDSVLNELDECLRHKDHYVEVYRDRMKTAEEQAVKLTAEGQYKKAYDAWEQVYAMAFARDGELALKACEEAGRLARAAGDARSEARFQERKAMVYGMCGLPWEGKALLDSLCVSERLGPHLARTACTSYYDLYDFFHAYALPEELLNRNYEFLRTLEDSIKKYVTDPAELAMILHHSTYDKDAMITRLKAALEQAGEERKGVILTTISNKYFLKHDIPRRDYYWALAAVCNVKTARRDNEALTRLAARMFELGDPERGLRYARFAYEDAVAYHSRSRVLEVAPLLEAGVSKLVTETKELRDALTVWRWVAGGFSLFLAVMCIAWFRLWRSNRKCANLREEEQLALRKEIDSVRGDAEIKNEYISRFLNLSLDETFRIEQLKATVLQRLQSGEVERLKRMMADASFPDDFRQQCLHRFDIAFLRLYPNFTREVNKMLLPDGKIELPDNEVLNNDVRVLAFMRLGITDSQKIAAILGVAVNTVYFYRNKLRRKALRRESFEDEVMRIEGEYMPEI